jgi:hypothetical protein
MVTPTIIDAIYEAFRIREGDGPPENKPTRQNNPIDLRFASQPGAHCPRCGMKDSDPFKPCPKDPRGIHDIAVFSTRGFGVAAAYRQILLWTARKDSLKQMVNTQAPAIENNAELYLMGSLETIKRFFPEFSDVDQPIVELLS